MQAEYCFTVEGNDRAPTVISMRGLDAAIYYRPNSLLNLSHPVVSRLVLDSLRHWALEFRIDGFHLLSAEAMAQDSAGTVQDCPPLVESMAADPVLRACKLVAWPRDYALLPREGRRGFPHQGVLLQHNHRFGATLEWLSQGGASRLDAVAVNLTGVHLPRSRLSSVAAHANTAFARLTERCGAGCADVFQADWSPQAGLPGNLSVGRRPSFGVNTISSPLVDGTTLGSWLDSIFGAGQGDGRLRVPLMKSAILLASVARGTPQLAAVDLEGPEVSRFASGALHARRDVAHVIRPPKFETARDVLWFNEHGGAPQWGGEGQGNAVLGKLTSISGVGGEAVCVIINSSWDRVDVNVPDAPAGSLWHVLLDSGSDAPDDVCLQASARRLQAGSNYDMAPKAALLLESRLVERSGFAGAAAASKASKRVGKGGVKTLKRGKKKGSKKKKGEVVQSLTFQDRGPPGAAQEGGDLSHDEGPAEPSSLPEDWMAGGDGDAGAANWGMGSSGEDSGTDMNV